MQRALDGGRRSIGQLQWSGAGGRWLTSTVAASPQRRRQLDESTGLQLEQQRARGHVFESTGLIAPLPLFGKVDGKSLARPLRMGFSQLSNSFKVRLAHEPALHLHGAHATDLCRIGGHEFRTKCPNSSAG